MKQIKYSLLFTLLFVKSLVFSQQDGFWDKDHATYKEIVVNAGDKVMVKSEDLPIGTTEIVYRVTVLDENQQMSNSLVSLLKAIPDPTGISQGSAGALFLLSKVSGNDKCKYAIFTSSNAANEYKNKGKLDKACLYQKNPVNKDAKVLNIEKSACLQSNTTNFWIVFESNNWIMNQKILVEVVPWVNYKLSRGYTLNNRKKIINECKDSETAKRLSNSDDFCVCVLEKVQKEFKFQEFQKLLEIEKTKKIKDLSNSCLIETGGKALIYIQMREQAAEAFKQEKYADAITIATNTIKEDKPIIEDYLLLGKSYILTKQYEKAIKYLKLGEQLDETELLLKIYLAHAYLFNDSYKEAKILHKKYKNHNVNDSLSWQEKTKQDFILFDKNGMHSDDFDSILNIFN